MNPTIKSIIITLLKSDEPLSQIELVAITEKSNPSISRGMKLLLDKRIINWNYQIKSKDFIWASFDYNIWHISIFSV